MSDAEKSITNLADLLMWILMLPRKRFTKAVIMAQVEMFVLRLIREHQNIIAGRKFMAKFMGEVEPTSGLLTQKAFMERVETYLKVESRAHSVAFAVLDLAGFKAINDTHGHLRADLFLAEVGRIVKSTWNYHATPSAGERRHYEGRTPFDVGTRMGDEFFFFLTEVKDSDECLGIAKRLCQEIEKIRVPEIPDVTISVDIGIICVPLPPIDERFLNMPDAFTAVLRMKEWADSVMYLAKRYSKTQLKPTINQHVSRKYITFDGLLNKSRNEKHSQTPAS